MRKLTVLFAVGFGVLLLGKALAVDPIELSATVESVDFPARIVERASPTPAVTQYNYDAGLTNIGIHAPKNDCIWEGSDLTIWVKVLNAGYEPVDCAEVIFTLSGEELARVHVTGLYPDEVRKYSATAVAPPGCEPYSIDAHIDWPLDENPENNDIEDLFATGEEGDTTYIRDVGPYSGWCWIEGYEYPEFAHASKWQFELGGVIKYWQVGYSNLGYPGGHAEFFVFEADSNGDIIDDNTGGIMNMEFQFEEVIWTDWARICYPVCLPVEAGGIYYFGWTNRQALRNYWIIDAEENYPGWNWYKQYGVWRTEPIYDGDYVVRVCQDVAGVEMTCENLTPIFCRGESFYFKLTVDNRTGSDVAGLMTFGGYIGYDCDPGNVLINLVRDRTYPLGVTETYYFFQVPNAASPGQYSASVSGTLAGWDLFCCMNAHIIQCSPWRVSNNTEWELVEADGSQVVLPTVTTLYQNYPNPFNTETNISYTLAEPGHVTLKVYDITGRLVATLVGEHREAGEHAVTWDAPEASSGVYFYTLCAGSFSEVKRMVLVK